jgi:hypothetical protein
MNNLHRIGRILAIVFSVTFAALLFPTIVGVHGVLKSLGFVAMGVTVIWLAYFGLGALFGHINDEGKKEEHRSA